MKIFIALLGKYSDVKHVDEGEGTRERRQRRKARGRIKGLELRTPRICRDMY